MKLIAVAATLSLAALTLGSTTAYGDAARDERARQQYQVGRDAYNAGDFQKAYDSFMESFTLSHEPALLYNLASALQGLRRPHDAAEALRSYVRLKPDDPDRPQIEQRIRTLEEEQHLVDLERRESEPKPAVTPPSTPPAPANGATTALTASAPPNGAARSRARKRTALIVGLTAGAVVVAGVAIGLAFGLQPHEAALTPSPIGPIHATQ